MPDEIDERVLEANLIKYLDERLEALKRHEIHGKWISTNKKIVVNHDDYWFIIWDLMDEIWESAVEKFNCRELMVVPQGVNGYSTGYAGDDTELGHDFYVLVREKVESLFNLTDSLGERW